MRIEHMALYCHNIEAVRLFFEKYFSCTASGKYENHSIGFSSYFLNFPEGDTRLEIMSRPEITEELHGDMRSGFIHIAISLGNKQAVDSLTKELVEARYLCLSNPHTTGDGYYESCIEGPEGLVIELTI